MTTRTARHTFGSILQDFFCNYLIHQRNVSPQTVAAYRDTFRLLLGFLQQCRRKKAVQVQLADLDAPSIVEFLDYLEHTRHNSIRSRNARLAGIRCFLTYASTQDLTCLPIVQRVLAIPLKRFDRPLRGFLTYQEVQHILVAPPSNTFSGRRDRVLLAIMYNTGARVSELAGLRVSDFVAGPSASVRLHGKGRKERCVPLWKSTARELQRWTKHLGVASEAPLLPNLKGTFMTRSGIAKRLNMAVRQASRGLPGLQNKRISPHTFRHTTAMHLLQAGVDINVIALWLGHESPSTTHLYVEADLAMKQRALAKLPAAAGGSLRYQPSDKLLQFLEGL